PSNSAGSINQTSGSNIGGTFNEYLLTFNPNATSTGLNDIPAFGSIGYTAFRLGEVTVTAAAPPTVELTGVSGSTSLGNLEPENRVVGISLQTNTYNSIGSGVTASTTVPFSGINSYDFTGGSGGSDSTYVPLFGRECWGFNDFTLEAFVRGNGTTAEGNILYLPFNEGGEIGEYGRRMLCGINSSNQIIIQNSFRSNTGFNLGQILIDIDTPDPSTWYHLAIVRKNNKLYVLWNGEKVAYDIDSAGNGSFLDGGSISDIEGLGFLFKPFGGIDRFYPSNTTEFVLGSLVSTFPNFDGYIANFRSSYIAQYDVTQPTYYPPTGPFIGDESGTAYYAKTFSGTGNNNAGTAIPQAGINQEVVIQPEGITQLNSVSVSTNFILEVTGVSASTSLGNLVPGSEVIGVSLQAGEGRLSTGATTVTSPIPFAGVRSINTGNQSQGYSLYLPFQENDYSFYNDFTIETFLRGDGTTNDGGFISVDISNGLYNADDLNLYIEGNELQLNNYTFPGSGYVKKIGVDIGTRTTTDWYHFALVRKNNKLSMFWNGERVVHNVDSAGNGTADYIDITSNDAYLFEPFGGNNANNQGRAYLTYFGFGGISTDSAIPTKRWGGYLANCRTSYIAQYDPDISTLEVPTAPFEDNASGQSYYYKNETTFAQLNSSTTLPSSFNDLNFTAALGSITTEIGALGEADGFLLQAFEGNISAKTVLDPIVPTGQNLTTSLGPAAAGPGILVPSTGQNLTASLGIITLPTIWGYVTTGTTSTWTPVDTGKKAIGP
ncbi:MAG: LamG domain-containing protein, partial [Flavobacteriales bacterium]|nr:LamG domain-containing protein [Flavobacteriales bacterium]